MAEYFIMGFVVMLAGILGAVGWVGIFRELRRPGQLREPQPHDPSKGYYHCRCRSCEFEAARETRRRNAKVPIEIIGGQWVPDHLIGEQMDKMHRRYRADGGIEGIFNGSWSTDGGLPPPGLEWHVVPSEFRPIIHAASLGGGTNG